MRRKSKRLLCDKQSNSHNFTLWIVGRSEEDAIVEQICILIHSESDPRYVSCDEVCLLKVMVDRLVDLKVDRHAIDR